MRCATIDEFSWEL